MAPKSAPRRRDAAPLIAAPVPVDLRERAARAAEQADCPGASMSLLVRAGLAILAAASSEVIRQAVAEQYRPKGRPPI